MVETTDYRHLRKMRTDRVQLMNSSPIMISRASNDRVSFLLMVELGGGIVIGNTEERLQNLGLFVPLGAWIEITDYKGELWVQIQGGTTPTIRIMEVFA